MRAYLEVHDLIKIGIQIIEICEDGNLGILNEAHFPPAFAAFYWRRLRNGALCRSGFALCWRFTFATVDTKKAADLKSGNMIETFRSRMLRKRGLGSPLHPAWLGGSSVWDNVTLE